MGRKLDIVIRPIQASNALTIAAAFLVQGWHKPAEGYLHTASG